MSEQPKQISIAVIRRGDLFLIGKRGENGPLPGFWEFPGGKVDANESTEAAAIREAREETGLQVEITSKIDSVRFDYDHGKLQLHFFDCEVLVEAEVPARFLWVHRTELAKYQFPPANDGLLARLTAPHSANGM